MRLGLLLALQMATPPPMARIDFDLAKIASPAEARACETGGGADAIVVCARIRRPVNRFSPEEMEELARLYAERPIRAGVDLGGGAGAGLDFSPTVLPGSVVSNRTMVTLKLPF